MMIITTEKFYNLECSPESSFDFHEGPEFDAGHEGHWWPTL